MPSSALRFTSRDPEPTHSLVHRVTTSPGHAGGPVRTYLRLYNRPDTWVREDAIELDPTGADIGLAMAVEYTWADLLDREQALVAVPREIDDDFTGLDPDDLADALLLAEAAIAQPVRTINQHLDEDGGSPAERCAHLHHAKALLTAAVGQAREHLLLVSMHAGQAATRRWAADCRALDERVEAEFTTRSR